LQNQCPAEGTAIKDGYFRAFDLNFKAGPMPKDVQGGQQVFGGGDARAIRTDLCGQLRVAHVFGQQWNAHTAADQVDRFSRGAVKANSSGGSGVYSDAVDPSRGVSSIPANFRLSMQVVSLESYQNSPLKFMMP
jgi:hypothetical protein